jgi:hypothetical protein
MVQLYLHFLVLNELSAGTNLPFNLIRIALISTNLRYFPFDRGNETSVFWVKTPHCLGGG